MKKKTYTVCVFCGSKTGTNKKYVKFANTLGRRLAEKSFKVIYGGGNSGLMGALAEGVLAKNGSLISIIPKLFDKKKNQINSEKKILTKNLNDRKYLMIKKSDIFIALPGGFGTLDEIFELIALIQLALVDKKIIIINYNNFWFSLKNLIKDLKKNGFLYNNRNNKIIFKNSITKTIEFIEKNFNLRGKSEKNYS